MRFRTQGQLWHSTGQRIWVSQTAGYPVPRQLCVYETRQTRTLLVRQMRLRESRCLFSTSHLLELEHRGFYMS